MEETWNVSKWKSSQSSCRGVGVTPLLLQCIRSWFSWCAKKKNVSACRNCAVYSELSSISQIQRVNVFQQAVSFSSTKKEHMLKILKEGGRKNFEESSFKNVAWVPKKQNTGKDGHRYILSSKNHLWWRLSEHGWSEGAGVPLSVLSTAWTHFWLNTWYRRPPWTSRRRVKNLGSTKEWTHKHWDAPGRSDCDILGWWSLK